MLIKAAKFLSVLYCINVFILLFVLVWAILFSTEKFTTTHFLSTTLVVEILVWASIQAQLQRQAEIELAEVFEKELKRRMKQEIFDISEKREDKIEIKANSMENDSDTGTREG